jgi:hypothetical protein
LPHIAAHTKTQGLSVFHDRTRNAPTPRKSPWPNRRQIQTVRGSQTALVVREGHPPPRPAYQVGVIGCMPTPRTSQFDSRHLASQTLISVLVMIRKGPTYRHSRHFTNRHHDTLKSV